MNGVAFGTLEVAAIHPVICLQVADDRFDGLAPLEQFAFLLGQALGFTPVLDAHRRIVLIYPAIGKVDVHRGGFHACVLHQNLGLLELLVERVPVKRVLHKASGAHDQVNFERADDANLATKIVGRAGLALADATDFRSMPTVKLGTLALALAALLD